MTITILEMNEIIIVMMISITIFLISLAVKQRLFKHKGE